MVSKTYVCNRCKDKNVLIECACGICHRIRVLRDSDGVIRRFIKHHSLWANLEDDCSYKAVHGRFRRRIPKPELCQICNKIAPYDLANISGKYLQNVNDWQWLCRRCHFLYDGKQKYLVNTTGTTVPEERKRRISIAMKGIKHGPMTLEARHNMSLSRFGKPHPHKGHHVKRNRRKSTNSI